MSSSRAAWQRCAAIPFLLLATAGCASVPDLGPAPQIRPAREYAASASLRADGTAWPDQGWWLRYNDPQLDQLIEEGIAGSPDLNAAEARFRTAQGYAQRAGAALAPAVDAFADAQATKRGDHEWSTTAKAGLSFSFDLDLWGKNKAALAASTSDAEAAGYELAQARLALTTGIASTYADLAQLYAQRDSLQAAVEIREQTMKLVAQRVELGIDTRAELKQAEARVPQARADLAATDEAIALTRNALAALIGAGPDRGLGIQRPSGAAFKASELPANVSIDLVGRRPDIAAARAHVEAQASRIKEARAAFYPNISIQSLIGLSSFGIGNILSGGSHFVSASPAVTLPIFHNGEISGNYRGVRGQYDEAVANYDSRVVNALKEVADAVTSRNMLDVRLAESRKSLADFEEAYRLARQRYQGGLSTYLDVLSAEEGVLGARLDVAQLETRALELDIALVRALGGGFARA